MIAKLILLETLIAFSGKKTSEIQWPGQHQVLHHMVLHKKAISDHNGIPISLPRQIKWYKLPHYLKRLDLCDIIEGLEKDLEDDDSFRHHTWRKEEHNQRLYSILQTSNFTSWKVNNRQCNVGISKDDILTFGPTNMGN